MYHMAPRVQTSLPPTVSHAVHPVVVGLVNVTSTQADHALPSVATARIMGALLLKVRRERRAAETKHRTEQRRRVSIRHRVPAQRRTGTSALCLCQILLFVTFRLNFVLCCRL